MNINSPLNQLLRSICFLSISLLPSVGIAGSALINNQVDQPSIVNNNVTIPSRQQELPIPADGDCLYKSIIMAYLLPVLNDADLFNARLGMLIGENTIMQKEKNKDDKEDESKDDIKIDINQVWDAAKIRQNVLDLGRSNLVYSLRQYPFPSLVNYMRAHMGIEKKIWGGTEEIQKIADKLQITIKEYTPDPDDTQQLTEPLAVVQCDQGKPLHTLCIVKDSAKEEETDNPDDDPTLRKAKLLSTKDDKQRQHYRALLTTIPDFLLGQNNQAEKLPYPDNKAIHVEPKTFKNTPPKKHSIAAKKHLITCRGRQLWQGNMEYRQQDEKLVKGYLIITDDDLLFLFEQQPDLSQTVDPTKVTTLDLAQYHTIQVQKEQIIITAPKKQETAALTLVPKEKIDDLLYILRYATQRYYTLAADTLMPLPHLFQAPPALPKVWAPKLLKKAVDNAVFTGYDGTISYGKKKDVAQQVRGYITTDAILHLFKSNVDTKQVGEQLQKHHICALPLHSASYEPLGKEDSVSYSFKFNKLTPTQAQQLGSGTLTLTIQDDKRDFIGWLYYLHYTTVKEPLNRKNCQVVQCSVSCDGFDDTLYLCVDKHSRLSYREVAEGFEKYFKTEPLQLTTSKKKDNQLHNAHAIGWGDQANHHLIIKLAKTAAKLLPTRQFVCEFLRKEKPCRCYENLKKGKEANQAMFNHLHQSEHPQKLMEKLNDIKKLNCSKGADCPHVLRFVEAKNKQTLAKMEDRVHILAYIHPSEESKHELTMVGNEQLCTYLQNKKSCKHYEKLKDGKDINENMFKHFNDYYHPGKLSCPKGKKCPHLLRIEKANKKGVLGELEDRVHILAYLHLTRNRTDRLTIDNAEHFFAYKDHFAKVNPIQLPSQHPYYHLATTPYHPRQALTQLLLEALENKNKENKSFFSESPVCQGVRYFTLWEFPLIAKVTYLLHHPYHQKLGQPLNMPQACALLLYTDFDKLCTDFRGSQMNGKFQKWVYLDSYLMEGILALHQKEQKYKKMLYSGLHNIRFDSKVKHGFLGTYTSTSESLEVAEGFMNTTGMLMHITPQMRKHFPHCNVMWLSKNCYEKEHLFARSADTGLFPAYKWKGTIINKHQNVQIVRFTLAPAPLIVEAGRTTVLTSGILHHYSHIKLERNATVTTLPYNPHTQGGGRLAIYCHGDCVLEEGAHIHVNGCGHPGRTKGAGDGNGGGEGGIYCAGGGSYRSRGHIGKCCLDKQQKKALSGSTYGGGCRLHIKDQLPLGSAGGAIYFMKEKHSLPGARGGGALSITIDGTLQLGKKSGFQANGQNGNWSTGGAGSGGTLILVCKGVIEIPNGPTNLLTVLGGQSLGRYSVVRGTGGMGYGDLDYQYTVAPRIKLPHRLVCWLAYWMRKSNIKEQKLLFGWIALFVGDSKQFTSSVSATRKGSNKHCLDQEHQAIASDPYEANKREVLPKSKAIYVDYLYDAGLDAYQQKKYGQAIAYYQQAIENISEQAYLNDGSSTITQEGCYLKIAETYVAQGKYEKAIQYYKKAGQKAQSIEEAFAQLEQAQKKEIEMDHFTQQGLLLYIPLQAADQPADDLNDKAKAYPLTDYIAAFTGQRFGNQDNPNKVDDKDDEKKDDMDDDVSAPVGKKGELPSNLQERLEESQVLLLQGASGAGKSLAGWYIATQYKLKAKEKKGTWVAVFISLTTTYDGADLLTKALLDKGLDLLTIDALQQSKPVRILFVLDGFDEIITSYRGHVDLPDKVRKRFGFDEWKSSKFMISCRSHGITDSNKYQYLGSHPEVHLIPFTQEQMSGKRVEFPLPTPLRTQRASFPALGSSHDKPIPCIG